MRSVFCLCGESMYKNRLKLKMIERVLLILSCVFLLTGCGNRSAQNPDTDTENSTLSLGEQPEQKLTETDLRVMKSLVWIQAGDLLGSGVIYEEEEDTILIATAGHVLAHDTGEIVVGFPDGTQVKADSVKNVESCDLAFVWVDKKKLLKETRESCLPVQTDRKVFDSLEAYEDVWMYGGGSQDAVYAFIVDPWIYVEDFDQYMMLLQGNIVPGMSGGGVFMEDGTFVGILCGADDTGKVAAVPYSIVETEKP